MSDFNSATFHSDPRASQLEASNSALNLGITPPKTDFEDLNYESRR